MSKKQIGLRIDRILYDRFLNLCVTEKLRPGEAVEQLVRLAVDTGSVSDVYAKAARPVRAGQATDEVMFKSRLSRLKATLEYERARLEKGEELDDNDRRSDPIIEQLVEIARRTVNEELMKEFRKAIEEADRLYEKSEKQDAEELISPLKRSGVSMRLETVSGDRSREVPGN